MIYICDNQRHLICYPYSIDNLHKMAKNLNLNQCWFHSGRNPHYDIPKKRIDEIQSNCHLVIESKDIINIIKESNMNKNTFKIYTHKGYKDITLGRLYKGIGYSGISDGVEILGILIKYNHQLDSATLQDDKNMIHAVIPASLKEQ